MGGEMRKFCSSSVAKVVLLATALVVSAFCPRVYAATVDLFDSFPLHQGNNSLYAKTFDGSSYTDMGQFGYTAYGVALGYPFIYRWSGEQPWIGMHPEMVNATDYKDAVLAYLVPADATLNVCGTFQNKDADDQITILSYVKQTGSATWGISDILHPTNTSVDSWSFNFTRDFKKGDWLYFGLNADGCQNGDFTYFKGKISAVPEPVSCALFLLGAPVLAFRRFKKNRAA
jgi:hypothetical protein